MKLCAQEDQRGCVSLCIHQMASFTGDVVTQPADSLSLQRRSPYAVQSDLGLLFVGTSSTYVHFCGLCQMWQFKFGEFYDKWLKASRFGVFRECVHS